MKALALIVITIAVFSLVTISPCDANMFLFIHGVSGESNSPPHQNWIKVDAASWHDGLATGGAGPKHQFEVSVTKRVDVSSPLLAVAAADGRHFQQAILEFETATGSGSRVVFLRLVLTDVTVKSYSGGAQAGGIPEETVAFSFGKFEWNYMRVDAAGNIVNPPARAGFDVLSNKPF